MNQNKPALLSDRWTHAEHEGILVGRLGHGDVSSWAHATSKPFGSAAKPIRPNENKTLSRYEPRPAPLPSTLQEMGVLQAIKNEIARRNRDLGIILPGKTKFDYEERAEKVNRRTLEIATRFEEIYRKAAKKGKKAVTAAKQFQPQPPLDILADCPRTSPEEIEKLKTNILPREIRNMQLRPLIKSRTTLSPALHLWMRRNSAQP
jgi:hypothetical protein